MHKSRNRAALSAVLVAGLLYILPAILANDGVPFYPDKSHLLVYQENGKDRPIRDRSEWKRRRAHILQSFQLVAGPLPDATRKTPLAIKVHEKIETQTLTRKSISFAAERGDRVPAYLFLPKKTRRAKVSAVLCLHQTTSIGKGEPAGEGGSSRLDYARELAERGYVTLAPDYPNYGDYRVDPYLLGYASATMKGIWNHMRAIDVLESLPEVDARRVACMGHSLGGHNSVFAALFDRRIKAVVSSCGFNSFPKYYNGNLAGWSHKGYMPRIAEVYRFDPKRMPFDFTELVAAIAPRPFFINAPRHDANFEVSGVDDCVQAALPVYSLFRAADRLVVVHPDCEHDFPDAVREEAYAFLDKWLRGK